MFRDYTVSAEVTEDGRLELVFRRDTVLNSAVVDAELYPALLAINLLEKKPRS